jgi:hypothetical protein
MACEETKQAQETVSGRAGGLGDESSSLDQLTRRIARAIGGRALGRLPASLHSAFIDWVADVSNPDRLRNYELDYRYAVIQFIEWHESQTTQTIKAYREAVEQIDDLVRAVKMVQSEISDLRHRNSNQARIIAADKLRKGLEVALDQFIARDWV